MQLTAFGVTYHEITGRNMSTRLSVPPLNIYPMMNSPIKFAKAFSKQEGSLSQEERIIEDVLLILSDKSIEFTSLEDLLLS